MRPVSYKQEMGAQKGFCAHEPPQGPRSVAPSRPPLLLPLSSFACAPLSHLNESFQMRICPALTGIFQRFFVDFNTNLRGLARRTLLSWSDSYP